MEHEFPPPRRTGLIIQGALSLLLVFSSGYFFLLATQDPSGVRFLLDMLIALVLFAPLPFLVYRLYALLSAVYILRRDGLMLRWGLRREDIPINQIDWIRPGAELGFRLPLPWLRFPGSIIGKRRIAELGVVEYLASDTAHLLLVATSEKIYAISPQKTNRFMQAFREINELGSLAPLQPKSDNPSLLISRVWDDRIARLLILISFGVGLVLLGVTALSVPNLNSVAWMGLGSSAPAERLLLLPVLDGLIWLANLLAGIFLFRRGQSLRIAAYMLWGSSALVGTLLLAASLLLIF